MMDQDNYRLHLDIPLGPDQERAIIDSEIFTRCLTDALTAHGAAVQINYRLGNDSDRGKKNYLDINENGHASNKKMTFAYVRNTDVE